MTLIGIPLLRPRFYLPPFVRRLTTILVIGVIYPVVQIDLLMVVVCRAYSEYLR